MGQLHNELRRGPWSKAATAALGDTRVGGIERLSEDLQAGIDLWSQPEWAFLRDEWLCAGRNTQAAVAAQFSSVGLTPALVTGQRVFVVESVRCRVVTAGNVFIGLDAQPSGATTAAQLRFVRDNRAQLKGPNVPTLGVFARVAAATGLTGGLEEFFHPGGSQDVVVAGPWILFSGGQSLIVENQTVNDAIFASFHWRERAAFRAEIR